MAMKQFLCIDCEKLFYEPKWEASDGHRHRLASKTYHVPTEGLNVTYACEQRRFDGQTAVVNPAKDLTFARGMYITDDPEKQAFLDKYAGCCTVHIWEETHLPLKERQGKGKRALQHSHGPVGAGNAPLQEITCALQSKWLTAEGVDATVQRE